jgi:hypothetical protein
MNDITKAVVCGVEVNNHTIGVWFAGGKLSDTLAILYKDTDGTLRFTGRLRIYNPMDPNNDAWSGKDLKLPFDKNVPSDESVAQALDICRNWLQSMPLLERFSEFLMEGRTLQDFVNDFLSQDFNHKRVVSKPDQTLN